MVASQIEAGMRGDVVESMALYADRVDFLDEGPKSREEIAKDLPDYYAHWPTRRSRLVGGVTIETLSYNERKVSYTLDFAASNSVTGESRQSVIDVTWIVRRDGPSSAFKIVSHKQKRVSQESPTPALTNKAATAAVTNYIAALNRQDTAGAYQLFCSAYRTRKSFQEYSRIAKNTGRLIVDSISQTAATSTTATVEVTFREVEPSGKVISWHGPISLLLENGEWRIETLRNLNSNR